MNLFRNKLINLRLIITLRYLLLQHHKVRFIPLLIASHPHQHIHLIAFARLS